MAHVTERKDEKDRAARGGRKRYQVRLSNDELRDIEIAALNDGVPYSTYIRVAALEKARRK